MVTPDLVVANGESWRIEKRGSVVVLILWKRPDLSRERGAALVRETVPLVIGALSGSAGLVLDLRDAPSSWGPITHKAFVDAISAWDVARRPVGIVAADDALARLGVKALVSEAAPRLGKLCPTLEDAMAHAVS